jgi:hypothetical protein
VIGAQRHKGQILLRGINRSGKSGGSDASTNAGYTKGTALSRDAPRFS